MSRPIYPLLATVLMAVVNLQAQAQAQQAPEVATDVESIVAGADLYSQERIDRSIKLLESRATIELKRGVPDVADRLRGAAALLRIAPQNGEASRLAAEAAMAAERGAVDEALVLAESAAALSGDWSPTQ
jgi:hypothetical protein